MKTKYYAVRKGSKTGIFADWGECQRYTNGYSGAEFKSFYSKEEAEEYLNEEGNTAVSDLSGYHAYVDGSYDESKMIAGYGIVIIHDNVVENTLSGITNKYIGMNNVAGELEGAVQAVKWAINNGIKKLVIHHDYAGISKWVTYEWKANKTGTRMYSGYIRSAMKLVDITFIKVKGHSGDKYNDMADKLAGQAVAEALAELA